MPAALELLNNPTQSGISVARWEEYKWSIEWRDNTFDSIYLLRMLAKHHRGLAKHHRGLAFLNQHGSSMTAAERRWSIPLRNAQMTYGFYGPL